MALLRTAGSSRRVFATARSLATDKLPLGIERPFSRNTVKVYTTVTQVPEMPRESGAPVGAEPPTEEPT